MSIIPDSGTSRNKPAALFQAAAGSNPPHNREILGGVTLAQLQVLADRLAADLAALALVESPDPSWSPQRLRTWERERRRHVAAERQAAAAATPRPARAGGSDVLSRARAYLASVPGAVSGQHGHDRTFYAANRLVRGFDLTPDQAYPLFAEWNDRCEPPWSEHDLRRKLEQADQQPGPRGFLLTDRVPATSAPLAPPLGYDDHDQGEAAALAAPEPTLEPLAPPPDDPWEVAAELTALLGPVGHCPECRPRMVRNTETNVRGCTPRGCHRLDCFVCGRWKARKLFEETAPYLIRLTDPTGGHGPDGPRKLYGAIVAGDQVDGTIAEVRRGAGKYVAIPVAETGSCSACLTPCAPSGEIRHGGRNTTCLISPGTADPTFVAIHLPAASAPPEGFVPVATTAGLRAIAEALLTAARPKAGVVRNRLVRKSHGWGDKTDNPKSSWRVEGIPAIPLTEVREVVESLGVQIRAVFDGNHHGTPAAWLTIPARSLLLSLLIRGVATTFRPTADRIVDVARDWFRVLGPELGDGPRVEQVLRSRLWVGPALDTAAELAAAHQGDATAGRLEAEANEMMLPLALSYRADPGPHRGLLHDLFALSFTTKSPRVSAHQHPASGVAA
jgi:hypothetical protein